MALTHASLGTNRCVLVRLGRCCRYLFIPNVTQLDLSENDRYWEAVKAKRTEEYHGEYNNPKNLSFYERVSGAVPRADRSVKTLN